MADIVLVTQNAKYIHPAFGLRYLLANLGPLRRRAILLEFDIKQKPASVVSAIVAQKPKIVGLGIYIWNVAPLTHVVVELKRAHPEITIVLGGPEVSFEADLPPVCGTADYIVAGEAEFEFSALCDQLIAGAKPAGKFIRAESIDVNRLALPYTLYDEKDLAHRMTYVEASRGCPFECEYCISSQEAPVRFIDLCRLLPEFQQLMERGAKHFKFVDRSFNIDIDYARRVLEFFLERIRPGLLLHFEMIPDRFPDNLRSLIGRFPPGVLHFEVGVQTFNDDVARRIKRRQKMDKIDQNLRFLRNETGSLIHADLIAGLPGETLESFAAGFDRLVALQPHELQLGILKRLRGAPIVRHDGEWGMVYAADPPYEILENKLIDRKSMDRLKRFARYWELIANRGNFKETASIIWKDSPSPFESFLRLSDWLSSKLNRDFGIALRDLAELLFTYLTTERKLDRQTVAHAILWDYQRKNRRETPSFLR